MIKIEVYTLPVREAGDERQQIADSLAAIGFFRPESLTTAPATVPLAPVEAAQANQANLARQTADEATAPKPRGRPKKDAAKAEAPADPAPAEAAQDAADEAAEVAETKAEAAAEQPADAAKVYDVNDMRAAGKAYADAYGMPATLKDIPGIIGFAAFSQVPAEQTDAVTRLVLAAVEQNPHGHPRTGA